MIAELTAKGIARQAINYKLRDWLFSRQRFWGEPFPILHELDDTGKPVLVSTISEVERQNKGQSLGQDTVEILMSQLHEEVGAHVRVSIRDAQR